MCFSLHVEKRLNKISKEFDALSSKRDFHAFSELRNRHPKSYLSPDEDDRIYPNYWSPVIISEQGHRIIKPMRYRIRPQGSREEVPSKFNLFNARMDSLMTRKTWRPLLGKRHCLIPIRGFYEWVITEQGKKQIEFYPPEHKLLAVAGLYDLWSGENEFGEKIVLPSFAVITKEPPKEVEQMGHDRCPIILKSESWDQWLDTRDALGFLNEKENHQEIIFENSFL